MNRSWTMRIDDIVDLLQTVLPLNLDPYSYVLRQRANDISNNSEVTYIIKVH